MHNRDTLRAKPAHRTIVTEAFARALIRKHKWGIGPQRVVSIEQQSLKGTLQRLGVSTTTWRVTVQPQCRHASFPDLEPRRGEGTSRDPTGLICRVAHLALQDLSLRRRQLEAFRAVLDGPRKATELVPFAMKLAEKHGTAHYPELSWEACEEVIEWAKGG